MIDIVFQLLAFFILALSTDPTRLNPNLRPPEWKDVGSEPSPGEIVLELDPEGRLLTEKGPLLPTVPDFAPALEQLLKPAGEKTLVVLRADEATRYGAIGTLLEAVRGRGFAQVGLRLRRPE
jgi:biopolymer transport protein ExbD